MKLFNLSPAAARALDAWNAARPAAAAPAPAPAFNLCTVSGLAAAFATATGAFKAIHSLPAREQETARIYDDNGYCLYR